MAAPPAEITSVDLQTLVLSFQHSYSNVTVRASAEHAVTIFKLVVTDSLDVDTRQAAAIWFKNLILHYWRSPEDPIIPPHNREIIREHLVDALVQCHAQLRNTFFAVIQHVSDLDFPQKWPSLLPKIVATISAPEANRCYGGLLALLALAQNYGYRGMADDEPVMNGIIEATFPQLFRIASSLMQMDVNAETGEVMRVICRVFDELIGNGLPKYFHDDTRFSPWVELWIRIILREIPESVQPADKELRGRWPYWRAKRRSIEVWHKLFSRLANLKFDSGKAGYAEHFERTYAGPILVAIFQLLDRFRQGYFITEKVLSVSLHFMNVAIRSATTFKMLKAHAETLLSQILLPLISFTEKDARLWQHDPHEFIRNIFSAFYNIKATALDLMVDMCVLRPGDHFANFIRYLGGILQTYQQTAEAQRNPVMKEAALLALGALNSKLKKSAVHAASLEGMLHAYVVPDMQSPHGFLRARACWTFAQFYDLQWTNPEQFIAALGGLVNNLNHRELPVRLFAATALKNIVVSPMGEQVLRPHLQALITELLKLMNTVECDDLVSTLDIIIENYNEEVVPFAVSLIIHLAGYFMKKMDDEDPQDENDTVAVTCMETLSAIGTLMEALAEKPTMIQEAEPALIPMFQKVFAQEEVEYLADTIGLLTYATIYPAQPTELMWTMFPIMVNCAMTWGADHLDNLLSPFDNFICKAPDVFLAKGYLQSILHIFAKHVADTNAPEYEAGEACKLIECVLLWCRGKVDVILPTVLELALRRFQVAEGDRLKVLLFSAVANCFYYDPLASFTVTERLGVTVNVFNAWLSLKGSLPRLHDMKLTVIALTAILALPPSSYPPSFLAVLQAVVTTVIEVAHTHENAKIAVRNRRKRLAEQSDSEDDDDLEVPDDVDVGAETSKEEVEAKLADLARKQAQEDEEEEEGAALEDEDDYTSPLDEIDELKYFMHTIEKMAAESPAQAGALYGALSNEHKMLLAQFRQLIADPKREEDE